MNRIHISDGNNDKYIDIIIEDELSNLPYINAHISVGVINDTYQIHYHDLIKIAQWYENMPNYSEKYSSLFIPSMNLKFDNYFFEKGDGTYLLEYKAKNGEIISLHLWEQVGTSNLFVVNEIMKIVSNLEL